MKSLLFVCLMPIFSAIAAETPATFKVGDYSFSRPAKWEWVEVSSPMRKAQLRVPGEGQASADVIFFFFGPGDGGGTQANVDRWLNQFQDAKDKKVTDTKVGDRKVIYVTTQGTYSGGMPGQASVQLKDYGLLGAIVESKNGNVFVKMTGPIALVKSADAEFRKMVESAIK
jgi:hypothetical protein